MSSFIRLQMIKKIKVYIEIGIITLVFNNQQNRLFERSNGWYIVQ